MNQSDERFDYEQQLAEQERREQESNPVFPKTPWLREASEKARQDSERFNAELNAMSKAWREAWKKWSEQWP